MKRSLLIIGIIVLLIIGCGKRLPSQAKIIKTYNNGWVIFELDGRKFLHRYKYSLIRQQSLECITEISKFKEKNYE
ncbi:unnamed protein product [marine sediment metagenome]|uniref:Uncharacterized protein n=1 Tax=marine sediment metagenome TaxID=412755 RepID=X0YT53_9ZZZZ